MSVAILENVAVRRAAVPMSVEQYHRAGEARALPENVELIEGVVVQKMTKSPKHSSAVRKLQVFFSRLLPDGIFLNVEQPLTLSTSEPEPDLALIQGRLEDYELRHPDTARLVVEVALHSLDIDREKAAIYARAGVPEFWIVNLVEAVLEVYTEPGESGYRTRNLYRTGDRLPVKALGGSELPIDTLL